jgi:hypothetical protein
MLNVTDHARDRLLEKLAHRKATDDQALRFIRLPSGWRLDPDQARPDDTTFTRGGRNVLLLDAATAKALSDKTLDVKDTAAGARLTLR